MPAQDGVKRIVIWCVTVAGVAVAILLLLLSVASQRSGTRPVSEYPDFHVVDAEEWLAFVDRRQATDAGWVAVSPLPSEPGYRSPVAPDAIGLLEPQTCRDCHQAEYSSFLETAHARTSRRPSGDAILGSFDGRKNRLETGVPGFGFEMVCENDQYFQRLFVQRGTTRYELKQPIDLVIGSGNHGQSFLSWAGDRLCQMHVSYFTEFDQWTNSPGFYRDGTADFARPATGRCLDCHATWFAADPNAINRFDPQEFRFGVTCVRCHGPAREHVEFHRSHPGAMDSHAIVHPGRLERDRLNELCAQCHSGAGVPRKPPFSYRPGEPLRDYLQVDLTGESPQDDDPHSANQLARLMRSRCYQASATMNCITCHDPHSHERGQRELFSQRCRQCHTPEACGARARLSTAIDERCIQCHMPSRRDAEVTSSGKSGALMPMLRDHLIGIWPDAAAVIEHEIRNPPDAAATEFALSPHEKSR